MLTEANDFNVFGDCCVQLGATDDLPLGNQVGCQQEEQVKEKNNWISINEFESPSDEFAEAVFSLIRLLNYVIDHQPAIGMEQELILRDQVSLAMRFNRMISEPYDRKLASKLVRKNNDVLKTIKIMRCRWARKYKSVE